MSDRPVSDEAVDVMSPEALDGAVEGVIEAVGSEAVAIGVAIKVLRRCADALRASPRPLDDFERAMQFMADGCLAGLAARVQVIE